MAKRNTLKAQQDNQQTVGFEISDDDWDRLLKHRRFDNYGGGDTSIRQRITYFADSYCLAVSLKLTRSSLKKTLTKASLRLGQVLEEIDSLSQFTKVRDGLHVPEIFGTALTTDELEINKFDILHRLKRNIDRHLLELPKTKTGANPSFVFQLVRQINREITDSPSDQTFSRSLKERKVPKGEEQEVTDYAQGQLNDVKFFEVLFTLTEKITNVKVETETILEAIKNSASELKRFHGLVQEAEWRMIDANVEK